MPHHSPGSNQEVADYKVCLVSAVLPPAFAGAGHRVYKYAERLDHQQRLSFVLSHRTGKVSYQGFQPLIDERKVVRLLPEVTKKASTPVIFLSKLISRCYVFCSVGWHLFRHRRRFQIVHAFSKDIICMSAVFWARVWGRKAIVEMTLVGGDDAELIRDILPFRYRLLRLANAYVNISPALGKSCLRVGIPQQQVYVIGNPVDTKLYCPVDGEVQQKLREKLQLPVEGPIVLFVGGIIKRKGTDLIPAIIRKVAESIPSVNVVLVGPTDLPPELHPTTHMIRQEMPNDEAEGRLIFTGTVCNVHEYMQASDLFLFPSRREGFGTVLVEAMACGLPPVSNYIEDISQFIIDDGNDGFIVRTEDPDRYTEHIVRLLSNQDAYLEAAQKARQKAINWCPRNRPIPRSGWSGMRPKT